MDILIVVDMQNDFIDGALGTSEAVKILPRVKDKIDGFDGKIYFTRDTHGEDYLSSLEGKNLPIKHCIRGTKGWEISEKLNVSRASAVIDKKTFGSPELPEIIKNDNTDSEINSITLIGICTDICVISNAMLIKANFPEIAVRVDSSCCAGVTKESHENALNAMKACQIEIL